MADGRSQRSAISRPRRPDRILDSLWAQLAIALLIGIVVAAADHEKIVHLSFYTTTLAVGFLTFLIVHYVRTAILVAPSEEEIYLPDPARLTESITSAVRSSYAISSNWISLWRRSTFRHYLHLDAAASLIAYSFLYDSSLLRFSKDEDDLKTFFNEGLELVREIASGRVPVRKHRLRLLIYPQWVYDDYRGEIDELIRSHSAARIPCIPIVADELFVLLSRDERAMMRDLVSRLGQDALEKVPPRAPLIRWIVRQRIRLNWRVRPSWKVVFPDMLLVDAGVAHETSALWYYSRDQAIHSSRYDDPAETYDEADATFRVICKHALQALWGDYAPGRLGGVTIAASSGRLDSEAFFGRDYYDTWLSWIHDHKHSDGSARELASWMREERETLSAFMKTATSRLSAPDDGEDHDGRGLRLLDVGCGTGRDIVDLLEANGTLHVVGVDIIERNISEAWQRVVAGRLTDRAALFVADAASLADFGDGDFDIAICMTNTIGNLPPGKQEDLVRRLRAIVRPGGQVLMSVYAEASVAARLASYTSIGLQVEHRGDHIVASEGLRSQHFTSDTLRMLLEDNGLKVNGDIRHLGALGLVAVAEPMQE